MRSLILFGCLLTALTGCGFFSKHDHKASDPLGRTQLQRLDDLAGVYAANGQKAEDAQGFVHATCDGLLFTGLYDALAGKTDIMKAQGPTPGQWFRHPDHAGCSNDISRDMLIGLAFWAWEAGAGKVAQDVVDYAKAHNMKMGEGPVDVVTMSPELLDTFYKISRAFGGADDPALDTASTQLRLNQQDLQLTSPLPSGFLGHLLVLHELLRAQIYGGASSYQLDVFKGKAGDQQKNALFQAAYHLYTDGDQQLVYEILDDETLFPTADLPTAGLRCEEYLWQRDENRAAGGDWAPCDVPAGTRPHSGVDLRLALRVAENKLRKGTP